MNIEFENPLSKQCIMDNHILFFFLCSDNRPSSWKDSLNKKSSSAVLAVEDEIQGLTQMAV